MSKNLAEAIGIISSSAVLSGMAKWTNFGEDPVVIFCKQLYTLVGALSLMSTDVIEKAVGVINSLAPMIDNFGLLVEAFKAIPNTGGLAALWFGNNDIDDFGIRMVTFINVFFWTSETQAKKSSWGY